MTRWTAAVIATLCVLAVSCSDEESMRRAPPTSGATEPATADPAPTGNIYADLRQSSRDAALGRIEVWIGNDTADDITHPDQLLRPAFRDSGPGRSAATQPFAIGAWLPALPPRPAGL